MQELLHLINQHNFVEGLDDEPFCIFDGSGKYSIKSLSLQVVWAAASSMTMQTQVSIVWKNLAPPRMEFLVWFILQERLRTKDRL